LSDVSTYETELSILLAAMAIMAVGVAYGPQIVEGVEGLCHIKLA
tara:strand:+ start:7474 stop:7608 length:135 start_codon:yes stop_codon:yes gene_type:complete